MKNKINKNSTLRQVLQIVGTELLREGFNENIHVASTMANIKDIDNVIITDLRFPNELQAIKNRGGISIRVNRGKTELYEQMSGTIENPIPTGVFKEHESETALDLATFDYVIDNNSDIQSLIEKVKEILIKENIL